MMVKVTDITKGKADERNKLDAVRDLAVLSFIDCNTEIQMDWISIRDSHYRDVATIYPEHNFMSLKNRAYLDKAKKFAEAYEHKFLCKKEEKRGLLARIFSSLPPKREFRIETDYSESL